MDINFDPNIIAADLDNYCPKELPNKYYEFKSLWKFEEEENCFTFKNNLIYSEYDESSLYETNIKIHKNTEDFKVEIKLINTKLDYKIQENIKDSLESVIARILKKD